MEHDWLLDEYERLRLVQPYQPVSPGWRHLGWSAFWAVTGAITLAVFLLFTFSSRVEDSLLIGAGVAGVLSLISLANAAIVAVRHRRQMEGPYQPKADDAEDSSTQMGTSRPARAM